MGQKVSPIALRLGLSKDWLSKWYAEGDEYTKLLHEDLAIRQLIESENKEAAISKIEIERRTNEVKVTIHSARPGLLIGRKGQRVEELRNALSKLTGKKVQIDIKEVREPELDATLVAKSIAEQIERRVSYRRAMKRAVTRAMELGAKGIKIRVAGRLGGAEMKRRWVEAAGSVPLHTLRADIDYGFAEAITKAGKIGVKVWIYKGDVTKERIKTLGIPEIPSETE